MSQIWYGIRPNKESKETMKWKERTSAFWGGSEERQKSKSTSVNVCVRFYYCDKCVSVGDCMTSDL